MQTREEGEFCLLTAKENTWFKKRLDTEGTSHSPHKEEDRSTLSLP